MLEPSLTKREQPFTVKSPAQAAWLAKYQTPVRSLLILSAALFASEYMVMHLLERLPAVSTWVHYTLDALLMLLLAFPALLLFVLQPLYREIERRHDAEAKLRRHHESLEETIQRRTAELTTINEELHATIATCHRNEAALRESEAKYRNLFETMNEGFALQDLSCVTQANCSDCRLVEVNPAFERLTGLTAREVVGRAIRQVLPTFDTRCLPRFCRVAVSGEPDHFETFIPELGKWFELHVSRNQPGRLAVVLVDITQRKATEQALAESQQDLSRAQAVAHTGNWRLNLKRNELRWSDETYRIFELPIGTPITYDVFLQHVHADDRAYVDREWKAALTGHPYDIVHRIVAHGNVKWVRERAELEFDRGGELSGGFGTVQDITELKTTEAALAESERRYREIVELSPDGIIVQRDHRCVFANSAAQLLIGSANSGELPSSGWNILDCIQPADLATTSAWLQRIRDGNETVLPTHECQLAVPRRAAIDVEMRAKQIRFEGTAATQIIFRDITERKKVRADREALLAQLANERAILNVTMENTRAQLAYLDPEFRFRHVNSAYERGCGYTREQLIGRRHFELFPNAENEAIFRRVRDTGEPVEFFAKPFEFPNQPGRGITYWDWTLVCMRNGRGEVEGLVLSLMDVTPAKRAAVALRESEERVLEALQVGRMFAFEWDPLSDAVIRSPHCAEILGLQENATRDTGRGFLARIHPDDRDRFVSILGQLSPSANRYRTVYRVIRPDRSVVILEESARGVFDANGALIRLTGVTADVTQREQAQREEFTRMARAATVDHLAASLAHELRQPLTAVVSNAEAAISFLHQQPQNVAEVNEALKDIIGSADRAGDVIQRLRALHRKTGAEHVKLDLNELMHETLQLLRSEMILRQISCLQELDPHLPPVKGNRIELQQVIINLLLNAADAMAELPVQDRSLRIRTSRGQNSDVRVTVSDSGTGLTSDAAAQLFSPFFTTKSSGMGMGLNVCRSIIQAHGGQICGVNNPDRGATFHFTVPIQP